MVGEIEAVDTGAEYWGRARTGRPVHVVQDHTEELGPPEARRGAAWRAWSRWSTRNGLICSLEKQLRRDDPENIFPKFGYLFSG